MQVDIIWGPVGSMAAVFEAYERETTLAGADCAWIPDHLIGNNMHPELAAEMTGADEDVTFDYWHDPFVTAAALAGRLGPDMDFGIGVTDLIRRGPVDIARSAASVSQVIGRPLLLGLGAGEKENLLPVDYDLPEKPVGHFEAGIEILREILDSGRYRSQSGYEVELGYNELPAKLYIGGQRPRMMRITAQYGDGWFPAWKMSVAEYEEKVAYLRETSAQHDRPCPDLAMLCTVVIGPSREHLYEELGRRPLLKLWGLQASGDAWARLGTEHPFGDTSKGMFDVVIRDIPAQRLRELAPELPSEIVSECYFMGNADEIFRELVKFRRAGMERAVLCNSFVVPPQNEDEVAWSEREFSRLATMLRELD